MKLSTISIELNQELYEDLNNEAKANLRSMSQQFTFWALVGKNAIANPDLPIQFIVDSLIAKNQSVEPFNFED